jgi:UDP-glucose 4-epimerase
MRVIVTGGAGFIGSHVADALLAASPDNEVLVLDDLSTGRRQNVPARATFVQGDLRNADVIAKTFADFKPDAVSHQGAQTSVSISAREPLRDAEVNILGGLNILNASVKYKVQRVVFASTGGAIYGEIPDGVRATEQTPPNPLSPYACSKFAFEKYLTCYKREHGLASTVLRYANVYGPRQDPHGEAGVVAIFTQRILSGEPIQINARKQTGDTGCIRDYVFVSDVVRANMLALGSDGKLDRSPVNVCTGVGTSTQELAQLIEQAVRVKATLKHGPRREGDVERSVLDPGSPSPLGTLVPIAEGIAQTVKWFRERSA